MLEELDYLGAEEAALSELNAAELLYLVAYPLVVPPLAMVSPPVFLAFFLV